MTIEISSSISWSSSGGRKRKNCLTSSRRCRCLAIVFVAILIAILIAIGTAYAVFHDTSDCPPGTARELGLCPGATKEYWSAGVDVVWFDRPSATKCNFKLDTKPKDFQAFLEKGRSECRLKQHKSTETSVVLRQTDPSRPIQPPREDRVTDEHYNDVLAYAEKEPKNPLMFRVSTERVPDTIFHKQLLADIQEESCHNRECNVCYTGRCVFTVLNIAMLFTDPNIGHCSVRKTSDMRSNRFAQQDEQKYLVVAQRDPTGWSKWITLLGENMEHIDVLAAHLIHENRQEALVMFSDIPVHWFTAHIFLDEGDCWCRLYHGWVHQFTLKEWISSRSAQLGNATSLSEFRYAMPCDMLQHGLIALRKIYPGYVQTKVVSVLFRDVGFADPPNY